MTVQATAPSTVAFTHGRRLWTAWVHGVQIVRVVAMARPVHRLIRYRECVRLAGTCQQKRNSKLCSRQSAVNQPQARCSSPHPDGIVAMAWISSPSPRSLPATGSTVGITTARAAKRTSGVLQRAVATTRTTWACTTTSTMRTWTTTTSTTGFLFVASRTSSEASAAVA